MACRGAKRKFTLATLAGFAIAAAIATASSPTAAAACKAADEPLRPAPERAIPPYPIESILYGEQGQTLLALTIGTDGAPTGAVIARSSGSDRLDSAAAEFVREKWRWLPAVKNCQPVAASIEVSVNWILPKGDQATRMIAPNVLVPPVFNYPADALSRHEQGITVVSLSIPKAGQDGSVHVKHTSGFADLDARSLELAQAHDWSFAWPDGDPVNGTLTVFIIWRLQASAANAQPAAPH